MVLVPVSKGGQSPLVGQERFYDHLIPKNNNIIYGKTPIYRATRSIDLEELICVGSDGKEQ